MWSHVNIWLVAKEVCSDVHYNFMIQEASVDLYNLTMFLNLPTDTENRKVGHSNTISTKVHVVEFRLDVVELRSAFYLNCS